MRQDSGTIFSWLAVQRPAMDLNGPRSVPFRPLAAENAERPAIELLRETVQAFGDHIASDDGERRLSYGEIWSGVSRLAGAIHRTTGPDRPVAVLLPNDARYQVAVLACVAAGCPCVMLDCSYPADRNAEIIRDAAVAAVIGSTTSVQDELVLPADLPCLNIDDALRADVCAPTLPDIPHRPGTPAFIIYTSGSTGRPKGIVLSQQAVLHRATQKINATHQSERDVIMSLHSPCTIMGLAQILECVITGAALIKLDLQRSSLGAVLHAIADRRATIMSTTPAMWRAITRLDGARSMVSSLRTAVLGGDVLLQADLELMRRTLPRDCDIVSAYGATEASTMLQWHVPRGLSLQEARVPAGYPMAGFDYAIVDEAGNAAPEGETGELVVRSRYTALGSWRDGQLHPDPFTVDPQDSALRIYRTGDLVRVRPDGVFVTLGRKDRQLKISGNRIEPTEIEDVLRRHPAVTDAAVVARRTGETIRLLAFVVARKGTGTDLLENLDARLRRALPSYMQPTQILSIDIMPLSPGRKIDENRLLAIAEASANAASARLPAAPAASLRAREAVAQAWRRTMDRQSLEADRPFAEAGGDSLRLLELIFHLEQKCDVSLPLENFHGDMRPSEFAASLDKCLEGGGAARTDLPCVVLLPGYAGDEPRLAQFRADCAHALRFMTITYPDWTALAARGSSAETVLAAIVRQIEAACGSSRLVIAGYSMGGDFAYAVATRLAAVGREIALLAVLDTNTQASTPVNCGLQWSPPRTSFVRRLPHFVEVVRQRGWEGLAAAMHLDQRVESRWFLNMLRLVARLPSSPIPKTWLFQPRRQVGQALLTSKHTAWCNALKPVLQDLHTVLFRSEERRVDAALDLGWSSRCTSVDVICVRGNHRTMFDRPQRHQLSALFVEAVIEALTDKVAGQTSDEDVRVESGRIQGVADRRPAAVLP